MELHLEASNGTLKAFNATRHVMSQAVQGRFTKVGSRTTKPIDPECE